MKATLNSLPGRPVLAAFAALLVGLSTPASAGWFAKYDGIDGESKDTNHDKWIEVLSVDWGVRRETTSTGGGGGGGGTLAVDDLVMTLKTDKATPKLMEKCLMGEVIPKLEIDLTATYGGTRQTYLKYELTNVMITSYSVKGSSDGDARPDTVCGVNFEMIKVTYTEYDENDGSQQDQVEFQWNIAENTPG